MKKILLLISIFTFFIVQTASAAEYQPDLRVKVLENVAAVYIETTMPAEFQTDRKKKIKDVNLDTHYKVEAKNGKIFIDGKNTNATTIFLRAKDRKSANEMRTFVQNTRYPGGMNFVVNKGKLIVVNVVPIEEYLRGVVPNEMQANFPLEALKAQSITARTYALKNRGKHGLDGYDLCNGVHCQVYRDVSSFNPATDEAIAETRGQVLYFGNVIIDAPFHADSGGRTASSKEVWGGDYVYLQSVEDIRFDPWQIESKSDFDSIAHIYKSESNRVEKITFKQGSEFVTLTGVEIRKAFNLPSTMFDVECKNKILTFTGYGRGHGVGMSQLGAAELAERGKSCEEILKNYFQKITIKKLY